MRMLFLSPTGDSIEHMLYIKTREERDMASLREEARHIADEASEAIAWIAVWKTGKSWHCESYYPDYTESKGYPWNQKERWDISEEDKQALKAIVDADPNALLVNGYYMNIGSLEEMTMSSLVDGLRWQYEINGGNLKEILEEENKRIYNDIPLESILYGLKGNQRIIVRDWETVDKMHYRDTWGKDGYKVAIDGDACVLCGYKYFKINHAKYHGMEVTEDGTLVFDISTAYEQY